MDHTYSQKPSAIENPQNQIPLSERGGPIHLHDDLKKLDCYGMLNEHYQKTEEQEPKTYTREPSDFDGFYSSIDIPSTVNLDTPLLDNSYQISFTLRFSCNLCKAPIARNTTPEQHVKDVHLNCPLYKCTFAKCSTICYDWESIKRHSNLHVGFCSPPTMAITKKDFEREIALKIMHCFANSYKRRNCVYVLPEIMDNIRGGTYFYPKTYAVVTRTIKLLTIFRGSQKAFFDPSRNNSVVVLMNLKCMKCGFLLANANNFTDYHILHALEHIRAEMGSWGKDEDWTNSVQSYWLTEKINKTLEDCFDPYKVYDIYQDHMKQLHSKSKPESYCHLCLSHFSSSKVDHAFRHSKLKPFACGGCCFNSERYSKVVEHIRNIRECRQKGARPKTEEEKIAVFGKLWESCFLESVSLSQLIFILKTAK